MEFNPNNNIVKRCLQGMGLEEKGQPEEASKLFIQAWNEAKNDFEKFLAAHYVARYQKKRFRQIKMARKVLAVCIKNK